MTLKLGVLRTLHRRRQNVTQDVGHGTLFVSTIVLRLAYKTANYRPDERLLASVESLLLIEVIHVLYQCACLCVHVDVVRGFRVYALSLHFKSVGRVAQSV